MTTIENYENYKIFENGDVINVNTGKLMKLYINRGYKFLKLHKNGKGKNFLLHRLLGLTFIPNPENKKCIDHINRDKLDNRLCNLRWATQLENCQNKGFDKTNTSGIKNVSYNGIYWRFKKTINKKDFIKHFKNKKRC